MIFSFLFLDILKAFFARIGGFGVNRKVRERVRLISPKFRPNPTAWCRVVTDFFLVKIGFNDYLSNDYFPHAYV